MDRIEQLMKDARPSVGEPNTTPGTDSARSMVFSSDPNVVSLADRKPRWTAGRMAAVGMVAAAGLAVAGVGAAVVLGGVLLPEGVQDPASTGTPSAVETPTPSPATGAACTVANIDQQAEGQARAAIPAEQQRYYTVLGCAEGWLVYDITDEGATAVQVTGVESFQLPYTYLVAKADGGRWLTDLQQDWSVLSDWPSTGRANDIPVNGKMLSHAEAMDLQFTQKGIPAALRPALVGEPPAPPSQGIPGTLTTYTSADGRVSFDHPAEWTVRETSSDTWTAPGAVNLVVLDLTGRKVVEVGFGGAAAGLGSACDGPALPYTVLESVEVSGKPYNAASPGTVPPRFVYQAFESNGVVLVSFGITTRTGATSGSACQLEQIVDGPAEAPQYVFANVPVLSAGDSLELAQSKGAQSFATMDEARNWQNTDEYKQIRQMILSSAFQPQG